ncbi:MAG: pyridoxal-phosphate dependent enzyme [Candidatus Lokiarchaeota archaeon]
MGEGGTICRKSKKLGELLNLNYLFFKDETQNPTNSFKDRTAALLTSHARSWDFESVICASNGNQGASMAAYTSLEGMECLNIIPKNIDIGKKAQMIAYNSELQEIGDTVDDAISEADKPSYIGKFYQATPELNPLTLEAQKTIVFEIIKQIGAIDWIIIPMGSGGLLVSIWKGLKELFEAKIIEELPKLVGVQSKVLSPIVNGFKNIDKAEQKSKSFKSYASGIIVKDPKFKDLAIKAINESKGKAISIPENLMLTSTEELARNEGLLVEPASALTLAGLTLLQQNNEIERNEKIVSLITGSGLKTPYVLEAISSRTKTAGMGILSTKLKILSHISVASEKGIYGSKIKEMLGKISLPAVYQHLKELESNSLIQRKKEGKTVLYTITKKGKKVLHKKLK